MQRSSWNIKSVNETLPSADRYGVFAASMGPEEQRRRKPGSPEATIHRCPREATRLPSMYLQAHIRRENIWPLWRVAGEYCLYRTQS